MFEFIRGIIYSKQKQNIYIKNNCYVYLTSALNIYINYQLNTTRNSLKKTV